MRMRLAPGSGNGVYALALYAIAFGSRPSSRRRVLPPRSHSMSWMSTGCRFLCVYFHLPFSGGSGQTHRIASSMLVVVAERAGYVMDAVEDSAVPLWNTVFCAEPIEGLTADEILAGITDRDARWPAGVDYLTLAEWYDVDLDRVGSACRALSVGQTEFGFRVSFGTERPVDVHTWSSTDFVREHLSEVLPYATSTGLRRRLAKTTTIYGVEFGFTALQNMGVVFAYEVARYLGNRGAGLIRTDEERWLEGRGGTFQPYQ